MEGTWNKTMTLVRKVRFQKEKLFSMQLPKAMDCHTLACTHTYTQTIEVGLATGVRALRMTFMGELGWELNIPTEV